MDDNLDAYVRSLFGRLRDPRSSPAGDDDELERAFNRYSLSFAGAEQRALELPAWVGADDEPWPIDPLEFGLFPPDTDADSGEWNDHLGVVGRIAANIGERSAMRTIRLGTPQIEDVLAARLDAFLGVAAPSVTALVAAATVSFTVHTSRLRKVSLHRSPFVLTTWLYFDAGTAPLTGQLPYGLYKFAGTGARTPWTVDPGRFDAKLGSATLTAL